MNFNIYFLVLATFLTLLCNQVNPGAALRSECSSNSACDTNEQCNGTTCICSDDYYESESTCNSTSELKPQSLTNTSKTSNSVTLSWTSPDAPGYTNSYVVKYNIQGKAEPTEHNVSDENTTTTVQDLVPGATYTFIVVRTIFKDGEEFSVPDSESLNVVTNGVYGDGCTAGSGDHCQHNLTCVNDVNKCLCHDLAYYFNSGCQTTISLKPVISNLSQTYNSVSLTWKSLNATGYDNSYSVKYSTPGQSDRVFNVTGEATSATVPSLSPGTAYTFVVVRSISREGRTQLVPESNSTRATTEGVYGDSCRAGITDGCKHNLTCVKSVQKCLCATESYYNNSVCISINNLKPTGLASSSTHNSVTLNWTSPDAPDYTNSYVVKYNLQGQTEHNVSGNLTSATIHGLSPGTTYTFVVVRSISREGRTQLVPESNSTLATKKDYGSDCNQSESECRSGLKCVQLDEGNNKKCLCENHTYRVGEECMKNDGLKPIILNISTTTESATILWNSTTASNYTSIYTIKYMENGENQMISAVEEDTKNHTVTGLIAGRNYSFVVSRSIKREERTQRDIDSVSENETLPKIDYGQNCSLSGTCQGNNMNCYFNRCKCDPGFFRNQQICSKNDLLQPKDVHVETLSTTQLYLMWKPPDHKEFVDGYDLDVLPNVPQDNININGTTAILSLLTPGERYNITVKSKVNYLDRNETASAGQVSGITKPATVTGLNETASNFTGPNITIAFNPAAGKSNNYSVQLQGSGTDAYNKLQVSAHLSVVFTEVTSGNFYTITIITKSINNTQSDPHTERRRVMASPASEVQNLSNGTLTSRSVVVSWKRPLNPNGKLFEYSLEVYQNGTCTARIVFNCTECIRNVTSEWEIKNCSVADMVEISNSDISNVTHKVTYNISLLYPDTNYEIKAVAYNEEGRGNLPTAPIKVHTLSEAARMPSSVNTTSRTSNTVSLSWVPKEPRPGNTSYIVAVQERNTNNEQFSFIKNLTVWGYENTTLEVAGLSSYWKYRFSVLSQTDIPPPSQFFTTKVITTEESAPKAVVEIDVQKIADVYDNIIFSWVCPSQKDGRNGVIKSATIIYKTDTKVEGVVPVTDTKIVNATLECSKKVKLDVTPEFNYTFEVFISNTFNGTSNSTHFFIPPGPAKIQEESVKNEQLKVSSDQRTIPLSICPKCILNGKNGRILSSGVIVCKDTCPVQRSKREGEKKDYYDNLSSWKVAEAKDFSVQYRATPEYWLEPMKGKDEDVYQIGTNNSCGQVDEKLFCNGPLPGGSSFMIQVFVCTSAGCDTSQPVTISTKEPPTNVALIAGAVCGILVAIVIVVVVFLVIRHRRRKKRDENPGPGVGPGDENELIKRKRPTCIKNFEEKVDEMHKDSNLLFSEEFEDINILSPKHSALASETGGNKLKNRYVNILPFDHSRVKLLPTEDDEEETDYINANYIPGYRSLREYIATQGPMQGTINDFWRMIWEQNVPIIVMLSDLMEKGKPKVDRYYPENMEPVNYGDIQVEMTNYSPLSKYVIRIFKLQVGNEVRMVRHYFLPGWQDFGANLTSDNVIDFMRSVRMEIKPNTKGPVCVHCSAGVGRTGTYISLDVFQQHIDEEVMDKELDIFDFVLKMRQNRSYMVQTEKQYIFIHDTIKEMVIRKKKEIAQRDNNVYMNNEAEDLYVNQAFETDPGDIYMNVDTSTGRPTTAL